MAVQFDESGVHHTPCSPGRGREPPQARLEHPELETDDRRSHTEGGTDACSPEARRASHAQSAEPEGGSAR